MKNIYGLLISLVTLLGISSSAYSQCTVDASCNSYICPDPETAVISDATEGELYALSFTMNIPTDTSVVGLGSGTVHYVEVSSIDGLPSGLSYNCTPSDCKINGGGSGCFEISGTPTDGTQGVYTVKVNTKANLSGEIYGNPIQGDYPYTYEFSLSVLEGGVNSLQVLDERQVQVYPNPASNLINIETENLEGTYELVNSLGSAVKAGEVKIKTALLTQGLEEGTYYLRITADEKVLVKKVVLK